MPKGVSSGKEVIHTGPSCIRKNNQQRRMKEKQESVVYPRSQAKKVSHGEGNAQLC